ncbi:DUF6370 family protein [Hymenobacter psychrotolerans]|uniref:Glutaminyl-tRNA synthetase n=1 Tax=Hymenobacter psychrotolerans DSM 18569 TaxID=1121959 RepID=A0A1M6Y2X5_9BACT|nr:DUF6370 family protein [Hymenobacter psychrotolerans]SHL12577.1 hypothetical protein SAMN02746009_02169 [Hymenobacter psychrotolerans DSM 18569]
MKSLWMLLLLSFSTVATVQAQSAVPASSEPTPQPAKPVQQAEAACGQCRFGLPGKGCDLAVRLEGKAYFVDGTTIDSHGDAHAADGFCNAVRKAEVQGEVVDNRFRATYFRLLP